MTVEIIVGLFSVFMSAVSSLVLVNWRLKEVEKRLDNHNSYAQKFAEATKDIALIQKDIDYIKRQLEHVEKDQ